MLIKIISGGQSGADMGGLLAAERLGIPTGGTAAKGYRTENGPALVLRDRFGLRESRVANYSDRTLQNVADSDGTVIVAPAADSPGTVQTIKFCERIGRPYLLCDFETLPVCLSHFIRKHNIRILNVAGNRESVAPGITAATNNGIILCLTANNRF